MGNTYHQVYVQIIFLNTKVWFQQNLVGKMGMEFFPIQGLSLTGFYQCILNQEEHHRIKTFRKEYISLLKKFEIEFKDEYLFKFYEDE